MDLLERRLKAVANRKRLLILRYLKRHHSAVVSDIAQGIDLSLKATSKHLQLLRAADIVTARKRGLFVAYRLRLPQETPVQQLLGVL